METGSLMHTPGICKCADCAWLLAHLERAIDASTADGAELDASKKLTEMVLMLHGKGWT
jgi:hypothetical protein